MVSDADRASEELLVDLLADARPDDGLIGEEGAARTGTTGLTWVCDPLDGTTNYLYGLPQWAVSVAVEDADRPGRRVRVRPVPRRGVHGRARARRDAERPADPTSDARSWRRR